MGSTKLGKTKNELVGWIQSLTDNSLLAFLNAVKLSSEEKTSDWWAELTENDRTNILSGIRDYEQGKTIDSKEFWKGFSNG